MPRKARRAEGGFLQLHSEQDGFIRRGRRMRSNSTLFGELAAVKVRLHYSRIDVVLAQGCYLLLPEKRRATDTSTTAPTVAAARL